ncbi:hypothetical protein B296_00010658 [Ensete ventricosum]|uniref:Uncharacterized protein n=1 Tax=Ensete ventricosum TaxID=4639 RepID=A0A427BA15_ENSVE|nr:hypothetical protein B296_00010658 [Ensete ventricosum]
MAQEEAIDVGEAKRGDNEKEHASTGPWQPAAIDVGEAKRGDNEKEHASTGPWQPAWASDRRKKLPDLDHRPNNGVIETRNEAKGRRDRERQRRSFRTRTSTQQQRALCPSLPHFLAFFKTIPLENK